MTGEPARGPRGEGVGTEEIPGTEIGKEELEGNRCMALGRLELLSFPKAGGFGGQFGGTWLYFQSFRN